jgi:isoleucyl-tRNA synthetase
MELRQKAGLKVRQPLASIEVTTNLSPELVQSVKDELNVKTILITVDSTANTSGILVGKLDTKITPELKQEGDVRELMRAIQDARKVKGLSPEDRIVLVVSSSTKELILPFEADVLRTVGAREARTDESLTTESLLIDGATYAFGVHHS